MTKTQNHRERHEHLHKCLDELVADFISTTDKPLSQTSIAELIQWSAAETRKGGNND